MTVIRTTRALLVGAVIAAAGTALAVAAPATAAPQHAAATPVTTGSYYLALGDSVPFGYREATNTPTPNYQRARNFQGYPELVGKELGLKVVNASCPGETSSSFIHYKAQSNGCEASASGTAAAGYRSNYPLHRSYKRSQLVYANNFLKAHKNTKLVTLMIGANDGFICQATTTDQCTSTSEIGKVQAKIQKNVAQIIGAIRNNDGYTGQIVIVNYYSTDYTNSQAGAVQQGGSLAINRGMDQGAWPGGSGNPNKVQIASVFQTFRNAAKQASGDDCTAGLLTQLSGGGCGVHPSVAGQNIIAGQVIQAIKK